MTIAVEVIERWLCSSIENEVLEFKEAKSSFEKDNLLRYCCAIANEKGGYLVLGVSDKRPRKAVGSKAFSNGEKLNKIKHDIMMQLSIRVETQEVDYGGKRILIFDIPGRPAASPLHISGAYWMRAGESLVPMTADALERIFNEDKPDWLSQAAKEQVSDAEVIELLDTQAYFDLLEYAYPENRSDVLERLECEGMLQKVGEAWTITNMAALTIAKRLDSFSSDITRKAVRFIMYDGGSKLHTKGEVTSQKGYAVGFDALVDFVHSSAPRNQYIEEAVREEVKMFPRQALRELIANALVHQDFSISGKAVMIEMYDDRVEISNPGKPEIRIERFIDENKARNEVLTNLMRRLHVCEEKGSGIDKVIAAAEIFQLPAPRIERSDLSTKVVLYAHQKFANMNKVDRIRACYQHCSLMYVCNQPMSNQTLRKRFGVSEAKQATISTIIGEAKKEQLIRQDASDHTHSTRYARYIPFWVNEK